MKKFSVLFIICFFYFSGQAQISLKEVIKKGIQLDSKNKNLILDSKISELTTKISKKNKMFDLNFAGSYVYNSETIEMDISELTGNGNNKLIKMGTQHQFDSNFSITQPIFTGGLIKNDIKIKEINQEYVQKELKFNENKVIFKIKNSYFRYQLLKKNQKLLRNTQSSITNHIKRIEEFYKNQLIKKTDLLESRIKLKEIKIKILNLDEKLSKENNYFKKLTGVDILQVIQNYKENDIKYKEAVFHSKTNHPYFMMISSKINIAKKSKDVIKGKYYPQIFGFLNMHYGKPGLNFFEDKFRLYFQTGIKIKLNLNLKNNKKDEIQRINFQVQRLENLSSDFEKELVRSLKDLFSAKNSLNLQLKIIFKIIDDKNEECELKKALFFEEQIDNIDYLNSIIDKNSYFEKKSEILIKIEMIKANINNLIYRRI